MKVFMIGTALLPWALSQSQVAVEPSLPPSTVALVVAYADGRVNYELTSAKPASPCATCRTRPLKLTSGGKHTAGVWSPAPLDVIEIESVLWADGSSDGMPVTASPLIAPDAGRRLQLTRITDILRKALGRPEAGGNLLARIRSEIRALPDQDDAQLPVAQTSMRSAKAEALRDVTRFEQDPSTAHDPAANARWVRYTIERYDRWIARLAQ